MAVYTHVDEGDLRALLANFDLGALTSFKGIAEGVENSNYFVQTDAGRFILTLYEKRVASEDLPFFLGLMEHLSARGLTCPRPVADRNGVVLHRLGGRDGAIFTYLDGTCARVPSPLQCSQSGEAMARFHALAADFDLHRDNALGLAGWYALRDKLRCAHIAPAEDYLAATVGPGRTIPSGDGTGRVGAFIDQELTAVERGWPEGAARGVIHADFFPNNVFFNAGELSGIIDFYFACEDVLLYDVAIAINAWCFDLDDTLNVQKSAALLDGYLRVRPQAREELAHLPVLARAAALRFFLTRAFDWINTPADALVVPLDPVAYLKRSMFHAGVRDASAYSG